MKKTRLFTMVLCLAALFVLVVLSVYAAFIGADRAGDMFRSPLMLVFWIFLAAALAAVSLRFSPRRVRIGAFCMHMGALLILLGGFWGSERVHIALSRLAGASNAYAGYMALFPGVECDVLYAQDMRTEKGRLPFSLRLESFNIERHEPDNTEWLLWVETIRGAGEDEKSSLSRLDWAPGETMRIQGADAELTVLDYIERARPVFARGPELAAVTRTGERHVAPAEPGRKIRIEAPAVEIVVKRVFENLKVVMQEGRAEVVEAGGGGGNHGLLVELQWPDGAAQERYVMASDIHGDGVSGLRMHYMLPAPVSAQPDAESDMPAMRIRLVCGGHEGEAWLIPAQGQTRAGLAVGLPADGEAADSLRLNFHLAAPEGEVRSYKSDVSVLESGGEAARKTIMVNSPLSHGGYHVYQHSYDSRDMAYTVLYAKSDRGLSAVCAGFIFLCAGAAWWGAGALTDSGKPRTANSEL